MTLHLHLMLAAAALGLFHFTAAHGQKGELSFAAGRFISFPSLTEGGTPSGLKVGLGLEAIGQYNFSNRSALLLKTSLTSWGFRQPMFYDTKRLTFFTFQGGYNYQFGTSGFFIDGLAGVNHDLTNDFPTIVFTLGTGKQFIVKNDHIIDAGIDWVVGDDQGRVNFKAVFTLLPWPSKK